MEHQVKNLPKSEVEISVTLSAEEMQEYRKQAADIISRDVKIKGFRPGHVPLHVLESHVGSKHIDLQAQEIALQKSYAKLVTSENIPVVARPQIKIQSQEPFSYTATVAVLPEVTLGDYQKIKVKKEEVKVTDKDVDETIDQLKTRFTTYKEVERKSKNKDRVEVDFAGFDQKGKELEGTVSKNHPLILGSNTMIPGFEDELVGLKKGEKKEFTITFPKDYHKEDFRSKKVKFAIEIKMVEEPEEAELNEELIEKITGQKMSVKDFQADVRKNLQARNEQEAKNKSENDYVEALIKGAKIELPEALVHEEAHNILHEMQDDMSGRGMDFHDFLKQANIDEEELIKKYVPEAEKRLKIRLALQKVIELEKVTISDQEMADELTRVKSFYPSAQHDKIEQDFEGGQLRAQISSRLSLRKLFAKVLE